MSRTSSRRLSASILVLASTVAAILAAEALLRLVDFSYFWSVSRRPDPVLGWTPAPGVTGWQRIEGKARVTINTAGWRDREHTLAKPRDAVRIAVLGDSFTEAVQVPLEETFWSVMEDKLLSCRAASGHEIEVLSFGVSGYSTAQELLVLRNRVWRYDPDLVVLAFFAGNDLGENLRALVDEPMRPYFVLSDDGSLSLDNSFRDSPSYRMRASWYGSLFLALLTHSRLLQAADEAWDLIKLRFHGEDRAPGAEATHMEPGIDDRIYAPPRGEAWAQAWRVTEELIRTIHDEVARHGKRFLLLTLTTGAQVHPDPELRAAAARRLGVEDLSYADTRLRELGQREGFPVLSLAPELAFYATAAGAWLHGFDNSRLGTGHWNSLGHALAGGALATEICDLGLLGPEEHDAGLAPSS